MYADTLTMLTNLSNQYDHYQLLNMYTSMFLATFGSIGNMFALFILIYARNKLPRIVGSNYLVLLTVTNTLFLAVHFYTGTFIRLVYYLGLDEYNRFHVLDSSEIACKLLTYLKYCARSLNTMLTVCFSLERLIAVYYPLQMRSLNSKCSVIFRVAIIVSLVLPSYSLFLTELTPNTLTVNLISDLNLTKSFNLYALTPSHDFYTCSASRKNFRILVKFHFLMFFIIFMCYIFTSVSIFAIIVKLKKSKNFIFSFKSKASSSLQVPAEQLRQSSATSSMIELFEAKSTFCRNHQKTTASFLVKASSRNRSLRLINHRIHDTKILSSISISFVLFNAPSFIIMIFMLLYMFHTDEQYRYSSISVTHLMDKMKIQSYLILSEIFQLVNFSVTGLLFFCSGQIFRLHALKCLQRIWPC